MKDKQKILIISSLISIGLLILFSVLHLLNSKILSLDNKWLLVSGVPLLIGLFFSGLVKSFKGFGLELETNLAEKVELELVGSVESYPTPEITKQSMQFLFDMPPRQRNSIERLQFVYGKRGYYDTFVVGEYINHLNSLRYIEIIDDVGKFKALIPAGKFRDRRNEGNIERVEDRIRLLIRSIENEKILENFKDAITETIKKTDTLLEAYKKFDKSSQGKLLNGDQILPVIDSNDKMIGLTRRIKLTDKIAEQVIKSEK